MVHVRVNDKATGQPTPVRIRFETADGTYLAPFGRLTEIPTGFDEHVGGNVLIDGRPYAYIDGTCEIQLPADPVTVEITKGPEYVPIRQQVRLGPGKLALRFAIERWIDLRTEGWYSGDICAYFLPPHAALLEGAAEDLAVVNLLARVWGWDSSPDDEGETKCHWVIPNLLAFSGQRPALQAPGHLVVVNTLNSHHLLGSVALLNSHRVIFPLAFGQPFGPDDWTLAAWCDQCHRKGGLVVLFYLWRTLEGGAHWRGEGLADLILGKVDAVEVYGGVDPGAYEAWYALLNCGLRATLVGGSSKGSNLHQLGAPRTYAHLQSRHEFTYNNWIEASRAGRTFVTNGPLLTLTVNGADPGAVVELPAGTTAVPLRAEVRSWTSLGQLEIIHNGQVAACSKVSGSPSTAVLEMALPVHASGWLAARCAGSQVHAHTAPVYMRLAGRDMQPEPDALNILLKQLHNTLEWARTAGQFQNDHQRDQLAGLFQSAADVLVRPRHS